MGVLIRAVPSNFAANYGQLAASGPISVRVSSTLTLSLCELRTSPQPLSLLLPPPPPASFLSSPHYNTAELSGAAGQSCCAVPTSLLRMSAPR